MTYLCKAYLFRQKGKKGVSDYLVRTDAGNGSVRKAMCSDKNECSKCICDNDTCCSLRTLCQLYCIYIICNVS